MEKDKSILQDHINKFKKNTLHDFDITLDTIHMIEEIMKCTIAAKDKEI